MSLKVWSRAIAGVLPLAGRSEGTRREIVDEGVVRATTEQEWKFGGRPATRRASDCGRPRALREAGFVRAG